MRTIQLRRTSSSDQGTFGELMLDGQLFHTGELPERLNAPFISCIPAGRYRCSWTFSNKHEKYMYQVLNVRGRTGVRFDVANFVGDKALGFKAEVEGCIALGLGYSAPSGNNQACVVQSGDAVKAFESTLNREDFWLEITNEYLEAGAPPAMA